MIRAIEIRKQNFFARPFSTPASIIAHTLTELGKQNNDLRPINTALKLRDLVATSLPPIYCSDRAYFNAADKSLESLLKKLEER